MTNVRFKSNMTCIVLCPHSFLLLTLWPTQWAVVSESLQTWTRIVAALGKCCFLVFGVASRQSHCQLSSGSNHTLSLDSWAPFHGDSAAPCWASSCNKHKQPPYSAYSAGTHDAILCLVAQLCLTLCDPMDCSPPGSSVHGILQARILEWIAMPSSRGPSRARDWTRISCVSCIADGFFMHRVTWEAQPNKWINRLKIYIAGNSLALQWLGPHTLTAEGAGSISSRGTKTPQVACCSQKKKKQKCSD